MRKQVVTITPAAPLEEEAKLMHERKIGGLPVVEDGHMIDVLMQALGWGEHGTRTEIEVKNHPGTLAEVACIMKARGINIASVLIVPQVETGQCQLVTRLDISNHESVVAAVEHGGFRVLSSTVG